MTAMGRPTRLRTGFTTPRKAKFDNERLWAPVSRDRLAGVPPGRPSWPASAACAAVLTLEVVGTAVMWAAIPPAWMWIGARVNEATDSLAAGGGVTFAGFAATTLLVATALARLDRLWVRLRRRAGHDQGEGALTQVVVISAALGIVAFLLWFYVLSKAFIIPFMPSQ